MKLRYYLRGLAAGLLIATIVLAVANARNHPLSDAEIRTRALKMGMVDGDSGKLSDSHAGQADAEREPESKAPEKNTSEDAELPEENEPEGAASEKDMPDDAELTEENEPEGAEAGDMKLSETDAAPAETAEPEHGPDTGGEPVTFVIRSGASSYTVSQDLAAAGLVADAAAFDTFLCDNGYARTVRTGTYKIVPGTSEEEIAKMIAK